VVRLGVSFLVVFFARAVSCSTDSAAAGVSSLRVSPPAAASPSVSVSARTQCGKLPGETPWHARVRLHADCWARGLLFKIRLTLVGLVVRQRLDRRWRRTPAILGERFARQDDVVLFPFDRRAWTAITRRAAIVKATRIAFALRRSVFRGRQIAPA